MQKRQLQLIEPFMDREIFPDNSIATYINCSASSENIVHKKNATSNAHNIEKSLEKKFFSDFSGNLYTFLVDTEDEVHRFHTEVQAVKFCINNDFFGDIQVFYKYEWVDYINDIIDDIPEVVEIFNVQDSVHFSWVFQDFEKKKKTIPQPHNNALSLV
ncbi:hypothetical protein [Sulfurimonas sp.]